MTPTGSLRSDDTVGFLNVQHESHNPHPAIDQLLPIESIMGWTTRVGNKPSRQFSAAVS